MANIITFTTDAILPDEVITAQTCCGQIVVKEDAGGSSGAFLIRRTLATDPQITIPTGDEIVFLPPGSAVNFVPGQVVARISAVSGSLNMVQIED